MSDLLINIKYLVDNSACSLKLKQKISLDMKEIERRLKAFNWYDKHYKLPKELMNLD